VRGFILIDRIVCGFVLFQAPFAFFENAFGQGISQVKEINGQSTRTIFTMMAQ